MIHTQGISLMKKPRDGVGADGDTEVLQSHGNLLGSSPRPLQPLDGVAGRVVFQQELDQDDDVGDFFFHPLASATGAAHAAGNDILIEQFADDRGQRYGNPGQEIRPPYDHRRVPASGTPDQRRDAAAAHRADFRKRGWPP